MLLAAIAYLPALTAAPVCDDGTSGNRVQAVYVRGQSQPDSYDAKVEKIREALIFADGVVDASTPDREMHLRLVHSGGGVEDPDDVIHWRCDDLQLVEEAVQLRFGQRERAL